MIFFPITALINALTSTIVFIIALARNPKSPLNRSLSYFAFTVAFWSYCYFLWQISDNAHNALFWCRSLMAGAIFIPPAFLHFSLTIIEQRKRYSKVIKFWYLASIIFLILDFTPLFVKDVEPRLSFPYWPTAGITYAPFLVMFLGLTIYAHVLMFRSFRELSGFKRNQIKYVFLGTAIGFLGGSTNYPLWYDIPIPPLGNVLVAVYVFLVAYAIIKYRLMDITIFTVRGLIFGIVYVLVLGVPFWVGFTLLGKGLWILPVVIAIILASGGPFIYNYLRRRADDILLKDQRRYQQAIADLAEHIIAIRAINDLLDTITSTITKEVRAAFCAIYLKSEDYKSFQRKSVYPAQEKSRFPELIPYDDPLITALNTKKELLTGEEMVSREGINLGCGLTIPCFGKEGLLALVFLGPKPNNAMYTADDILIFKNLSFTTSLAIENCTYWKEIEDRQRKARLQEMDNYSYSLAHEIDNPIQVILGTIELFMKYLLKELNLFPEKRKELEVSLNLMREAALRIAVMVRAVRDFGEKTTGKFALVSIEDAVNSFERLYYPQLKNKAVVFQKSSALKEPVYVLGEKPVLMQILVIIADNALHAMTGLKEKRAYLRIEKISPEWVRIYFSDNGYGINKDMIGIIFEPFTTTKASTEGTGMGLHNAKMMVAMHGGRIWAESEGPGKGATLVVELPIAKDITEEDLKRENKSKRLF